MVAASLRDSGSKRLSCVNLEREEHMRDEWLVLDLCRKVMAILTALSGVPFGISIYHADRELSETVSK